MLLEVHALKKDKARLVEMLRSTEEFKDFSDYSDDSGGNLRFLPGSLMKKKVAKMNTARNPKVNPMAEKENWIPAEAFSLAFDVTNQTSGEISPQLIQHLLISLNKIWRAREKNLENRLKKEYKTEIESLRRKLSAKGDKDGVPAKQGLAKVRRELAQTRFDLKQAQTELKRLNKLPPGMPIIGSALQAATQAQEEKRQLIDENETL